MIKSISIKGITLLIFLQYTVYCQSNSRSYDTNDWIPISQHTVYQNENGKQLKPSESNRQYQTIQQLANHPQHVKEQRLNSAHQIRLSSQPNTEKPVAQGLPFVHQHTPFLSQLSYDETKQKNNQQINQEKTISQNISPPKLPESHQQREEVQLLYVPLETLRQREQRQQLYQQDHAVAPSQIRFVDQQNLSPQSHKQVQLQNIQQDFIQQALQAHKLQQEFQQNYQPQQHFHQASLHQIPQQHPPYQEIPQFQLPPQQSTNYQPLVQEAPPRPTSTTSAPVKKRKPHQPPLAVYMGTKDYTDNEISVTDVLDILKDAKTITVQDYINEDSPKVFVGPSNLQSPSGYVKFDLPYLSSLDKHKREGIDKLPFFVAPLNYKTPSGYSKIPFPSPHVGSVVINQRNIDDLQDKTENSNQNLLSNQALNEKNTQLLYNEASTISNHNKNRQAFSTLFPVTSTVTPEIPYGPIPIKNQHTYSTPRTVSSTSDPLVSSTTPRSYLEPQGVSISSNSYPDIQYSKGNRFTSPPSTEVYSITPSPYSVTTNRNPSRTSHVHQRPQINLSTPDNIYHQVTSTRAPNRYLPETQSEVSVTTSKNYLQTQFTPTEQDFVTKHRFSNNYNIQKNEESVVQNSPAKLGFEAHITRGNFSVHDQQSDQEYRPTYQNVNVPNQYEIQTEKSHQYEDKPKIVTESSFVSSIPQYIQQYTPEVHYKIPTRGGENHETTNDSREQRRPQSHQEQHRSKVHQEQVQQEQYRPQIHQEERQPQVYQEQKRPQVHQEERQPQVYQEHKRPPAHHAQQIHQEQQYVNLPQQPTYQNLPRDEHRFVFNQAVKENDQPTIDNNEKQRLPQYVTPSPQHVDFNPQQHYKLPADLPISPQLPSLVNSLEDQAIRPLLAPLLLPTAEGGQSTYVEYDSEKINTAQAVLPTATSHDVNSYTPSTAEVVTETTTPQKRIRGKPRGTRPPTVHQHTSAITRPRTSTSHRGRRPYLEVTKQDTSEATTRAAFQRTRYTSRERPQVSSTTEQNKESSTVHQKRFRTRGRPVKSEEEYYTERVTESSNNVNQQFTAQPLQAHHHVTQDSSEISTEDHEKKHFTNTLQSDQPLTYLINGQHIINDNAQINEELNSQIYIVKSEAPQSEEIVQTHVIKSEEPISQVQPVKENTKQQSQSIDQSQYLVETTKPKTRSRGRDRSRSRQQVQSTTTHAPITEETKDEEASQEYGFFRQPNFKPLKMEYKQSSDIRTTNVQQTTFGPQYSEDPNIYYVSDARSSTPRIYQVQTNEPVYEDGPNQYLHSRVSSTPEGSYEDIKPITIRTTPAKRRFSTTTQSEETATSSERYHSPRPRKRPEEQTQRTKSRSRIRKPTTPMPKSYSSNEENYSTRSQPSHRETPIRNRSRGKTHFKPRGEQSSSEEDISENYPASFLKSQEQTDRRTVTPRSSFKLTIEPEESLEEQDVAYSTPSRIRTKSRELVKGEESQRYEKTVEGPNQIVNNFEKDIKSENYKTTESGITNPVDESTTEDSTEVKSEEVKNTTEITTEAVTEIKENTPEETTTAPITTTTTTTTTEHIEKVTKKNRRRGHWRLVGSRPVDMFQSAESQNIGSVYANNIFDDGKSQKIDKQKVAQLLLENPFEEIKEDNQEKNNEDNQSNNEDIISITTEETLTTISDDEMKTTLPEYNEQDKLNNDDKSENTNKESDNTKNEQIVISSLFDKLMGNIDNDSSENEGKEVTDDTDFLNSRIIGTSTTTEVSHETEICYKGRCVKSLV